MRIGARQLLEMRSDPSKKSWFRVQNKADDDTVTEVFIYDEIGFWGETSADFARKMAAIDTPVIHLHINSPGGEVFEGVAIYHTLKAHSAEIIVFVDALAASAASFIAQAGDKILVLRNATMMIHDASAICVGNAEDMHETGDLLDKVSDNIADIYSQRAGGTAEEWRGVMRAEAWYSAQEAVDAGLADEILDLSDEDAEKAKNKWNLSLFNYKSREEAPPPSTIREIVRIGNSAKEAIVSGKPGAPKNDTPEGGTAGAPAEPAEATGTPAAEENQPPVTPVTDPQNKGGAVSFTCNGTVLTDPKAVQAHITGLETFKKESVEASRKGFVKQLADDGKILASKMTEVEEFALDLSPEQYAKWEASWEAALPSPLFGKQSGANTPGEPGGATDSTEDRMQLLEEIVQHHRQGGMKDEQIKELASYKELEQLKAAKAQA